MELTKNSKIVTAAAVLGVGLALLMVSRASAAPPKEYTCAYCGQTFATMQELQAHVAAVHPGERIPIDITWS